jgi:predicted RNase H-like nuclease (RuvC/YqgF family)
MMKTCELETCASTFEAKRSDARFCSPTCRATASRQRRAPPDATEPPPNEPAAALPEEASPLALLSALTTLSERLTRLEREQSNDRSNLRLLMGDMEEAEKDLQKLSVHLKRLDGQRTENDPHEPLGRLEKAIRRLQRALQAQEVRISAIDKSAAEALTLLSSML